MTLAKWPNVPGDLAIYWYIVLGDLQEKATRTVLEQAEVLSEGWVAV